MSRVTLAFYVTGVLFVLMGMSLGVYMGSNENFTLAPVHAHMNLIGWASMALMGAFYAFAGARTPRRLAWASYGLMTAGVLVMIPSLAKVVSNDASGLPFLIGSYLLLFGGMLCFLGSVIIAWRRCGPAFGPAEAA